MGNRKKSTPVSKIGEFGLIDRLTSGFRTIHPSTLKGIGDDAAVLDYGGRKMVVTTDVLNEGIDFNFVYSPLKHLGYKSAVVGFSDVYAMNAMPRQMLLSVSISGKFTVEALEQFYEGIQIACKNYGVDLVGGDTSSSLTGMTIHVTVVGELDEDQATCRDGAREGDLILVSGDLGGAYMGLQVLEREKRMFESEDGIRPELSGYEYVLSRQLKPEARGDVVRSLRSLGIRPSSMIDVSDGLSSDLLHLCTNSGTGCRIFAGKIPIAGETIRVAGEFHLEPAIAALNGGEDYELILTLPPDQAEVLLKTGLVRVIGRMDAEKNGRALVFKSGQEIELKARGWNEMNQ